MINFDERTDLEKRKDKRYFNKIRDVACNLIVFAFHENHGDTNEAIKLLQSLSTQELALNKIRDKCKNCKQDIYLSSNGKWLHDHTTENLDKCCTNGEPTSPNYRKLQSQKSITKN